MMFVRFRHVILAFLGLISSLQAGQHVILTGGPALRKWENYRVADDQHDRWWANFIRASTLYMTTLRQTEGKTAPILWLVYRPGYAARGQEDRQPYTTWIEKLARDRNVKLVWLNSSSDLIRALNSQPSRSVSSFDYFGHSNKYCFMLDYSNDILGACTAWLHETDVSKIKTSIFEKNAVCKSWGCHTGSHMTKVWKSTTGIALEGATGKTLYTLVGNGALPYTDKSWTR